MSKGSLDPKGSGWPDYRRAPAGTIAINVRFGTVEILGTVAHVQMIGTLKYVGSVGYLQEVGTIHRLGTIAARELSNKVLLGSSALHVSVGSMAIGSWEDVSRFRVKSWQVQSSLGGSFILIGGAAGVTGLTGTYYKKDLVVDQFDSFSTRENLVYARALIWPGSQDPGKGTVRLVRSFQP